MKRPLLPADRTYRERMAQRYKNWVESMYISKAEFSGATFGTDYQTLSKTYMPVLKAGTHTLTVVAGHQNDFTGKTNTLLEIEIDGGGATGVATFKWRKETFMGRIFGPWTTGVLTDVDITVTEGIHVNFNDGGVYVVGDRWHVQACGSWHTPKDGVDSYLTSIFVYPYDVPPVAKAGFFRAWCGDYRIIDYITSKGEFPNWRTPIHLRGDGTAQFKVELAEIGAGDIAHIFVVMKGWDEA